MSIEGEIAVRIARAAGRVARVSIRSTRPLAAARVVVGRGAAEAAALLPRLYSVCANAQRAGSACALDAAAGRAQSPAALDAHAFAVALENLQEDLRCLLVDVPVVLGRAPRVLPVATVRRAFAPLLHGGSGLGAGAATRASRRAAIDVAAGAVEGHVLGEPLAAFTQRTDADALEAWARATPTAPAEALGAVLDRAPALGASDVETLPPMTRARVEAMLAALLADPSFATRPRVEGKARETGALARMAGHPAVAAFVRRHGRGVASRLAARVADVARTTQALADGDPPASVDAWPTASGLGAARVETARGMLLHCAAVRDGRVAAYGVVAPTEWNFQPGGPLERSLAGLDAGDADVLARDARLVVQSLDPCVACGIEVGDA